MWVTSRSRQLRVCVLPPFFLSLCYGNLGSHMLRRGHEKMKKAWFSKSLGGRECSKSLQTMSHWPNLACHLFLYTSEMKNDFYIFKWLGGESKRRIIYCDMWTSYNFTYHNILVSINFHLNRDVFICLYIKCYNKRLYIHDRDHLAHKS